MFIQVYTLYQTSTVPVLYSRTQVQVTLCTLQIRSLKCEILYWYENEVILLEYMVLSQSRDSQFKCQALKRRRTAIRQLSSAYRSTGSAYSNFHLSTPVASLPVNTICIGETTCNDYCAVRLVFLYSHLIIIFQMSSLTAETSFHTSNGPQQRTRRCSAHCLYRIFPFRHDCPHTFIIYKNYYYA